MLLKDRLRVLMFEDCREDIELSLRVLRSSGFEVDCEAVVTAADFIHQLRAAPYDVVLADYRMPGVAGMDVFELMKAEGIETPFILVTGSVGEETAVQCLKRGMADYVLKARLDRLPEAVRHALSEDRLRRERVQAEDALRSSEASYRSLIQSAPCGILRLSATDGKLLDVNPSLAGMLGYDSPADLLKGCADGGIALCSEVLSSLMAQDDAAKVVECEVQWKRKDGVRLFMRLAGRLLRTPSGAAECLEMIAENATERHFAQRRIQELNRLNTVLIHAGQATVRTRDKGTLFKEICRIIVEDGGFQMAWLGLLEPDTGVVSPRASWPQQDPYLEGIEVTTGVGPPGSGPMGIAIRENRHVVCNALAESNAMEPWKERAQRRSFQSMAAFPILMHGRPIGAISIYAAEAHHFDHENVALLDELAADVSFALEGIETARMHDLVADELNQFFALSLDLLFISDMDGYIQRLNPAWEKTLGFSPKEMRAKQWVEFVHPEDRLRAVEMLAGFRAGVEVNNQELRFLSKSRGYKWLVASATPALDRGVVFSAASDITERKQLEEQLRGQNLKLECRNRRIEAASQMKNEFLANISHELRSPLNGIIGFCELLYDGKVGALPDRPKEFVGRIHASASHLLQLINGLLDLSKIEAGHLEFHPERLSLSQIIHEVTGILSALAAQKQIRIETEVEPAVDLITIDGSRFRQVLYNYLSNALKFSGNHGHVGVRLTSEGATEFRLEVSDTGIGISEQDIPRLFVEFQQLDSSTAKRFQGTGLGLALTRRIVEAQGGRVGVLSTQGEGSTFYAVLPRVPLTDSGREGIAKILVVDHHDNDRLLISQLLKSNGYRVVEAASGAEAYEACQVNSFDAVTLDLLLGDTSGWETLAQIRSVEAHQNTPVFVISGCEATDLKMPVAAERFLTKPVSPKDLLGALNRAGVPMRIRKDTNERIDPDRGRQCG